MAAKSAAALLLASESWSDRIPTEGQLRYQNSDISMFLHFSVCTFGDCEQGRDCRRTLSPDIFDPPNLNTTQWLETAAKLGAKEVCLTAHHTAGFAMFQSDASPYGLKQSRWRHGRGDVVKEFVESCRQFGISPCLYFINPWDCWEAGDSAELYLKSQLGMLSELMNRDRYGKIDRFWFDWYGWASLQGDSPAGLFPDAWPQIVDHVRQNSPGTLMLPGPDGCLTTGESADGAYPMVNYINSTLHCSYPNQGTAADLPSVYGTQYVPFEADYSIQNPGDAWFYHEDHVYNTARELWDKYIWTAGRGAHFILNVPPSPEGVIPDKFVAEVSQLGTALRRSFDVDVGKSLFKRGPCIQFTHEVYARGPWDTIMLKEDLTDGQQILAYVIEIRDASTQGWTELPLNLSVAGQTVGSKGIISFGEAKPIPAVRFRCTKAIDGDEAVVKLASLSLHKVEPPSGDRRWQPQPGKVPENDNPRMMTI